MLIICHVQHDTAAAAADDDDDDDCMTLVHNVNVTKTLVRPNKNRKRSGYCYSNKLEHDLKFTVSAGQV